MNKQTQTWLKLAALIIVAGIAAWVGWKEYGGKAWDSGLASGNGRLEAVEIDIAAKSPGRIKQLLVHEGDFVTAGQAVAVMDTDVLNAQLLQAEAQLSQANSGLGIARSQLNQRESDKNAAQAVLAQRESELAAAIKRQKRSTTLAKEGGSSQQEADDDSARAQGASAAVRAAQAQVAAAEAAIVTAEAQVLGAESAIKGAEANVARIRVDIADSTLRAPCDGRVQYRVAQVGEVVGAGGRVLSMVNLNDVYMTFFLPTASAGKLAMGDEVRLVLDAAPQFVIPATVTFVASVAQFTPKTVETADEREKLMFRIRAQIAPNLLKKYIEYVKTGLPGMAYVRLDQTAPWPERLAVKMP